MILICQWEVSGEIASGVKCNDLLSSVPLDPLGRCHHKRSRSVIALTIFQSRLWYFRLQRGSVVLTVLTVFTGPAPAPESGGSGEEGHDLSELGSVTRGRAHRNMATVTQLHIWNNKFQLTFWSTKQQWKFFINYVTAILYPRNRLVVV